MIARLLQCICWHPAAWLQVEKNATVQHMDADFDVVRYHLSCGFCYKRIEIKHASLVGGVDAFLNRGKDAAMKFSVGSKAYFQEGKHK